MAKYPHLVRSGPRGAFNYRPTVPKVLRAVIGRWEIIVSLKSADVQTALPAYLKLARQTEEQFPEAKRLVVSGATSPPLKSRHLGDLATLTKQHFDAVIAVEKERRADVTRRALDNPGAIDIGAFDLASG